MITPEIKPEMADKLNKDISDIWIDQDTDLRKHVSQAANNWHQANARKAADLASFKIADAFQQIMSETSASAESIRKAKTKLRMSLGNELHAYIKEHLQKIVSNTYCGFLEESRPLYLHGNPNYSEYEGQFDLEAKARELLARSLRQHAPSS